MTQQLSEGGGACGTLRADVEYIILIPAWNESTRLPEVLDRLRSLEGQIEVAVIDDGSGDDTAEVARSMGATVLRHPFNLGYGAALQTGYKYALERRVPLVVQMDADGQHEGLQIPILIKPLQADEADLVVGSRFMGASTYRMGLARNVGRSLFRHTARLAGLVATDPTSGFQAMNRAVLELYSGEFFPSDYPDVDVLVVAHRKGLRILECPVTIYEGLRRSTLHGGHRAFYYTYRMFLSLLAASRARGS